MSTHIKTQSSTADTEQTLTLTAPVMNSNSSNSRYLLLHDLTITTKGADIAKDVVVLITNAAGETWAGALRSGRVDGAHFPFKQPIVSRGDITVVVDDAGASCVTVASAIYEAR